ncbi:hypothetical protein MHUMG1_00280 [Metarhizium humberi]|uniref:Uncharacterized protein n=1 Tax=Metarhizium humberi TaxID=2596975 RepID=A0A9P8MGS8_9HYPO|nr:hypothetical protein MHUMG1_00280 [Metarhizium humberi]
MSQSSGLIVSHHGDDPALGLPLLHPEPLLLIKRHNLCIGHADPNPDALARGRAIRHPNRPRALDKGLNQPPPPPLALPLVQQVNVHGGPIALGQETLVAVHQQPVARVGRLRQRILAEPPVDHPVQPPRRVDAVRRRANLPRRLQHARHVRVVSGRQGLRVRAPDAVAHCAPAAVVQHEARPRREVRVRVCPDVRRQATQELGRRHVRRQRFAALTMMCPTSSRLDTKQQARTQERKTIDQTDSPMASPPATYLIHLDNMID